MSGVVTIAQAEPSETPQQSYSPSGSAIIGAFSTSSSVMRLRRCALGFFAPLSWLFTEMCAIARFKSFGIDCDAWRGRRRRAARTSPGADRFAQYKLLSPPRPRCGSPP